jgi:hypothetical protein
MYRNGDALSNAQARGVAHPQANVFESMRFSVDFDVSGRKPPHVLADGAPSVQASP